MSVWQVLLIDPTIGVLSESVDVLSQAVDADADEVSAWDRFLSGPAVGAVIGAFIAFGGVLISQYWTRQDKQRDRDLAVEDKLREEVAELLVQRAPTVEMQRELGTAHWRAVRKSALPEGESGNTTQEFLQKRDEYMAHLERLRDRATRISFLTSDRGVTSALADLRSWVDDWRAPMTADLEVSATQNWWTKLEEVRSKAEGSFKNIEDATRALVASHGGTRQRWWNRRRS